LTCSFVTDEDAYALATNSGAGNAARRFIEGTVKFTARAVRLRDPRHWVFDRAAIAYALLPGVHRAASLAKRWLLGAHQGAVDSVHLANYLNEFGLRFNRRRSRSRGMVFYRVLELAVAHKPVRYKRHYRKLTRAHYKSVGYTALQGVSDNV